MSERRKARSRSRFIHEEESPLINAGGSYTRLVKLPWYSRFNLSMESMWEKIMFAVLIMSLICLGFFGIAYIFRIGSSIPCLTPECVVTSARIIKSMDTSIEPCDVIPLIKLISRTSINSVVVDG